MASRRVTTTTRTTTEAKPPGAIRRLLIRAGFVSEHITDHALKLRFWGSSGGDDFWPEELRKQITYQGCNSIKQIKC